MAWAPVEYGPTELVYEPKPVKETVQSLEKWAHLTRLAPPRFPPKKRNKAKHLLLFKETTKVTKGKLLKKLSNQAMI